MTDGKAGPNVVEVVWEGGLRFRGGAPDGHTLLVDGRRESAPSPVDALLVALGSCSAVDVVDILEKRRTPAKSVRVSIEFERAETPPRRVISARLDFTVEVDSEPHHVERAIELSLQKYCSVSNTFAPDTEIGWTADVRRPS